MTPYKFNTVLANRANYGGTSPIRKYIVIHYTSNDGDKDENNAIYFRDNIVKASAHYFVDDDSVTQSVPDNYIAYAVGGSKYANTKGGKYHGKCRNTNSISVELCDSKKNKKSDFTKATLDNAVALVKTLMAKYNIPIENVIRHYDVTGKICPKPFVDNINAWEDFKNRLIEKEIPYVPTQTITSLSSVRDIKWLQSHLNDCITDKKFVKLNVDGKHGKKTDMALLLYWKQLDWNVGGVDVNGYHKAGDKTIGALETKRKK